MPNNLRSYVNNHLIETQPYRSWYISSYGQEVSIQKVTEDSKNVYGDHSTDESATMVAIPLLFNWEEYNRLIEYSTASTHDDVPLTAQARVDDDIPKDSLIRVPFMSPDGRRTVQEVLYRVISIRIKHNLVQHSKELIMAPERRFEIPSPPASDTQALLSNAFTPEFSEEFD